MESIFIRRFRRLIQAIASVCIIVLLTASLTAQQNQQPSKSDGAKRLWYDPVSGAMLSDPEKKQKNSVGKTRPRPTAANTSPKYPGLHYWIELEGAGAVTDKRVFHTGERIRLHVRSNVDGYLSLWALDPSGNGELLYPAQLASADNFMKADSPFAPAGFITFAPPPEDERMVIFFSQNKDDVPSAKDLVNESSKFLAQGKKSLKFETDETNGPDGGTYVVSLSGGPIAAQVRLQHK